MNRQSSYSAPRSDRSSGSSLGGRGNKNNRRSNYGRRSWRDNSLLSSLVFIVLPFIVFNIILVYVTTASPKIEITVSDTTDYKTVDISYKVKTLLPIKEMTTTLESQPIEMTRENGSYQATLTANGTFTVYVKSLNGMVSRASESIAVLDDTPPAIDEDNFVMEKGKLEITLTDSQSGINYNSILALDSDKQTVKPVSINKETGRVIFDMEGDSLEVYAEDMAGNPVQSTFSIKTEGLTAGTDSSDDEEDEAVPASAASGKSSDTKGSSKSGSSSDTKETSKAAKATEASKSTKATEASKSTKATEASKSTKATEASKSTKTTEASKSTKATEASKSTKATEASKSTKATEASKSTKATEASKSTEATKATQATEAAKPTESSQAPAQSQSSTTAAPAEAQSSAAQPSEETVTIVPLS